jgi:hypothetical protein
MSPSLREHLSACKKRILDGAQMAMSESQFQAFRRLVLDTLGERGFERELVRVLDRHQLDGRGRGRE